MRELLAVLPSIHRLLRRRLTPKRYHHCVRTAVRAAELARLHGEDWFAAAVAGLVHDFCHNDAPEQQLKYLNARGILLDDFVLTQPQIWHAITAGAVLYDLGLRDICILDAVRWHTTGRAGMSRLEQIVWLADKTSSERTYAGVEKLRAEADRSLEDAMRYGLSRNLQDLIRRNQPIVSDAWEAYNSFALTRILKTEQTREDNNT